MTINSALDFIHSHSLFCEKKGLYNMQVLLSEMGDIHKELETIHIAGTNGKGSSTKFVSNILINMGLKVGVFTSPHLEKFNERISINSVDISDEELIKSTERVKLIEEVIYVTHEIRATEFEIITAIALDYFHRSKVDVVVLETGLGGSLDSTNVCNPIICAISQVSIDHTNRLGTNIQDIAREKAGIIKWEVPIISYPQVKEVERIIKEKAFEMGVIAEFVDFDNLEALVLDFGENTFNYNGEMFTISLNGRHQMYNAAFSFEIAKKYCEIKNLDFNINLAKKALLVTKWKGRLEKISENPFLVIDGAHNIAGVAALNSAVMDYFKNKTLIGIYASVVDKDVLEMLRIIGPKFTEIILIKTKIDKAMDRENIKKILDHLNLDAKILMIDDYKELKKYIASKEGSDFRFLAFGSLYYLSEINKLYN